MTTKERTFDPEALFIKDAKSASRTSVKPMNNLSGKTVMQIADEALVVRIHRKFLIEKNRREIYSCKAARQTGDQKYFLEPCVILSPQSQC